MVATTSGLTDFTMDVDDIIEEAVEPLGGEYTTGVEMDKARRTLNLLLIKLQNKNIPLNKVQEETLSLTIGVRDYDLDGSINDILELSINDPSGYLFIPVERWGLREYHQIPNKTVSQRPTVYATERLANNVKLKVWGTPDKTYNVSLLVSKRVEDITASYQRLDMSHRYYPLIVAWLTYELSKTRKDISLEERLILKADRDEIMMDTFEEDRERTDFQVTPGGISGR